MARRLAISLAGFLIASVALSKHASRHYLFPFPPLSESLASPVAALSDFAGIAMGFRKMTADIAWIQTLLYYGTEEEGVGPEIRENGGGNYPHFLAYCRRVGLLDPSFKYIYYYGGAVLGWNLNRMDEAELLLKEGIQYHPKEWRFQQFLAGLAYQKNHDIQSLTTFLEGFMAESDCPNILKALLANIYKKQKRYRDAIRIWAMVYESGDPQYTDRAREQIKELYPLARQKPQK